jgi:flagellar motor switch protein FliM
MTSPADEDQEAIGDDGESSKEDNGAESPENVESQDELASEWESMVGDDKADKVVTEEESNTLASREATRVLNQEEIDSLLGFDEEDDDNSDETGIQAILSSALVSYERLPMLEVVYDRLVRLMSTSLRNFTSDNVEVALDNITSIRFGDYLDSIPVPAMLSVIKAEEWDNYGLVTVDSSLIYSIVDVLLGGRRGSAAMRIEGRAYTTIERSLVERMVHVMLADLSSAFDPICPVNFKFERLETNPRFATISRSGNAAIVTRIRVSMEDRGGRLELLFPYATLEPVRELLLQQFMGEKFGRDSIWEIHLAEELWMTEVDLEAVVDQQIMRLSDVFDLKVGSRIMFSTSPESLISLHCGNVPMYTGSMGRKGNQIAIKIESKIDKKDQN